MSAADAPSSHRASVVGVVVVTYDPPAGVLERCMASVLDDAAASALDVRPIVVDTGGRAERRLRHGDLIDGRVMLIETDDNLGFGAAANDGFRAALAAGADVLVCLNDDVIVERGWLEPLVDALRGDDHVGGVQPVLLRDGVEAPVIDGAGVGIDRYGAGADLHRGEPVDAVGGATDITAVTGGAAAFSSAFLADVGGFDERFFLYYEDVELCRRGAARGWRCRLVPASVVRHVGSASTGRLGDHRLLMQERNRLWCTTMHGSPLEIGRAWGLSLRRLRHEPKAVHRRALRVGARGAVPRLVARVRRRAHGPSLDTPRRAGSIVRDEVAERPLAGVNVLGYHHVSSGLGDAAREFVASLRAAGVDVIEIDNDLSLSPERRPPRPVGEQLHDTTVAFVTAVEFSRLIDRFPDLFEPERRMIGYWFWELSTVPDEHVAAMALVDEVWAASTFVRDAYRAAADTTTSVRLAPLRLPEPELDAAAAARWRSDLGTAFTFLVSYDYFSVPERKYPEAAIAAFRQAFGDDPDVALVVKTINRDQRPDEAARIEAAAAGDARVRFVDAHLDDDDHHALLAAADCFVSPHRSEGLGLHLALAMWLGTPVIATRYGGVTDLCDDESALLCEYELVGVEHGGDAYPVGAPWAEVSRDDLVRHMRTIRTDAALRERLVTTARARIAGQPGRAVFGRRYRRLLTDLGRVDTRPCT